MINALWTKGPDTMLRNFRIGTRILLVLSCVAIAAAGTTGFIGYRIARHSLEEESFNKLTAVREMKASQIEDYFQEITNQVITFSEDRMVIDAMRLFKEGFRNIATELSIQEADMGPLDSVVHDYYRDEFVTRLNANRAVQASASDYWPDDINARVLQSHYIAKNPNETGRKHLQDAVEDGSSYDKAHAVYHPIIRSYLERFGYYDIFLVDPDTGHIVYTVFKEVDYCTSLLTGPHKDTNLAEAFRAAQRSSDEGFVKLVDYKPYPPSYDAQASFVACPIFDGDKKTGVVLFQMPVDRINDIMTNNEGWSSVGLGESGETYIVAADHMLRNQSRFLIEDRDNYFKMIRGLGVSADTIERIENLNSTIGLQKVETVGTRAALRGETGTQAFPDYRGVSVLSSYRPLDIPDVHWVIMSEIDEAEAFAYVYQLRNLMLGWLLCVVAIIVLVAISFARSIKQPLQILTDNARQLEHGNLDVTIDIEGRDEIGVLGRSFYAMRASIRQLVRDLRTLNEELEQKVADRTEELSRQKEMLENTLESLTHPFYVVDANDYTIMLANSAARKFAKEGVSTCHALTHRRDTPCDSLEDPCPLEEVKKTKRPVVVEHIHFDAEGNPRFAEVHGYPIFDDTGNVVQMIEYSLDITERKEAEARLKLQSAALESTANGIVITDLHGTIQWVNPAAASLTGYTPDEILGQNPRLFQSGRQDEVFYEDMWGAITNGRAWHGELVNKRRDGGLYNEEMTITPVTDDKGAILHFVAIMQDITVRKRLERELKKANERMKGELDIGREIQMSMLPRIFPAFPERDELAIHAVLHPAREVGGDFYDFFFLDEHRLCFCIGDVAGKGVPAALFMAVTKTLVKSRAMEDPSPASVLTHVNDELSHDNKTSTFVTLFLGILDSVSGEIRYANAGHNPPYVVRENGSVEKLDQPHSVVAGAMEGITYEDGKVKLTPTDSILMYTDGVTEAMDIGGKLYSEERLAELLVSRRFESAEDIVHETTESVRHFADGAEQADDITVLAVRYFGPPQGTTVDEFDTVLENRMAEIERLHRAFGEFATRHSIATKVVREVNLACDELLNNVISYAYRDDHEHKISVRAVLLTDRLVLTFEDDGIPFNPFTAKTPDTGLSLEEREIGGLGIHLTRSLMDKVSYRRRTNTNVVTVTKCLTSDV